MTVAKKKSRSAGTTAEEPKKKSGGKAAWKIIDRSSSLAASMAAPLVAGGLWRAATGRRPPVVSRDPQLDLREVVAWSIVGGALVELTKTLVQRRTAQYWVKSTGELPPGIDAADTGDGSETHDTGPTSSKKKSARRKQ